MYSLTTQPVLQDSGSKSSKSLPMIVLLMAWSTWNAYSTRREIGIDTSPITVASTLASAAITAEPKVAQPQAEPEAVQPQAEPVEPAEPPPAPSPRTWVLVASELAGIVAHVEVKTGDTVEPGAILFRLEDRAKRAELKMKQAERQVAKEQLAKLETPRTEERLLAQTKVDAAEAAMRAAHDAYQRADRIHKQLPAAVAIADVVKLEALWRIATSAWEGAKAQLSMLDSQASAADLAIAQAKLDQAQAAVDQVEQDLERLIVRARQAATVSEVNVRPGEAVSAQPGQRLVVMAISDPS